MKSTSLLRTFNQQLTTKTVQYNVINAIKNGIPLSMPPIKVERVEYGTDGMPYRMWVSNGNFMEEDND